MYIPDSSQSKGVSRLFILNLHHSMNQSKTIASRKKIAQVMVESQNRVGKHLFIDGKIFLCNTLMRWLNTLPGEKNYCLLQVCISSIHIWLLWPDSHGITQNEEIWIAHLNSEWCKIHFRAVGAVIFSNRKTFAPPLTLHSYSSPFW